MARCYSDNNTDRLFARRLSGRLIRSAKNTTFLPYWGRGIVPEALAAVLAFAKERLGLRCIRGWCDVENVASARVFEKTGFHGLGIDPKSVLHPNMSPEMRHARAFVLET
jgi:hypothetical protein